MFDPVQLENALVWCCTFAEVDYKKHEFTAKSIFNAMVQSNKKVGEVN